MNREPGLIHRINGWTTIPDVVVKIVAAVVVAGIVLQLAIPALERRGVHVTRPLGILVVVVCLALFFSGSLVRRLRR